MGHTGLVPGAWEVGSAQRLIGRFLSDFHSNPHYLWVANTGLVGEHRAGQARTGDLGAGPVCLQREPRPSLHIPVLGEEVVQHSQRGLQVTVDDVFWPWFWLFQSSILHELKSKGDVQDLLFKAVWSQEEAV